ncbi:hypothetical protein X748_27760 [Mesorhizobium sp. LNJC386A00]|nr:hypothetical protein X748_27760 [Mesorhizobium sp. LNJC386A00]
MTNKIATDLLAEERRQLGAGDRLEIGDTHQHQHLWLREVGSALVTADCTADGVGIGRPGQVFPAAGDGDQVIGAIAQFLADVVDQELNAAALSHNAAKRFATGSLAAKIVGRDAVHPLAPTRFRRQVLQLPVKQRAS